MEQSLVSVIIPTYSRPDNIIRAIDSVLAQSYKYIEIIVVDDNGTGTPYQIETEKVLEYYIKNGIIQYLKHEVNKNGAAARNTGYHNSKGLYLTFLDDDDEMHPLKIEKQVDVLEKADRKFGMAYTGCKTIKNNKVVRMLGAKKGGNLMQDMLLGEWGVGSGSNLLVRREAVDRVGGYDESFLRHQDVEFTLRLFRYYEIIGVDEILLTKYNDTKPRRPDAKAYYNNVEKHYLNKFRTDIAALPKEISNRIYYNSYVNIAIKAVNEPNVLFAMQMLRIASSYKRISLHDIMRIMKNLLMHSQRR